MNKLFYPVLLLLIALPGCREGRKGDPAEANQGKEPCWLIGTSKKPLALQRLSSDMDLSAVLQEEGIGIFPAIERSRRDSLLGGGENVNLPAELAAGGNLKLQVLEGRWVNEKLRTQTYDGVKSVGSRKALRHTYFLADKVNSAGDITISLESEHVAVRIPARSLPGDLPQVWALLTFGIKNDTVARKEIAIKAGEDHAEFHLPLPLEKIGNDPSNVLDLRLEITNVPGLSDEAKSAGWFCYAGQDAPMKELYAAVRKQPAVLSIVLNFQDLIFSKEITLAPE